MTTRLYLYLYPLYVYLNGVNKATFTFIFAGVATISLNKCNYVHFFCTFQIYLLSQNYEVFNIEFPNETGSVKQCPSFYGENLSAKTKSMEY